MNLTIGVDPAMGRSGWAMRLGNGPIWHGYVQGIENLSALGAIRDAQSAQPTLVLALIEYPTWRGHGTDAVRAAANCWIRTLKQSFPRKVRIQKIRPQTWMSRMGFLKGLGKSKPATRYVPHALLATGATTIDENTAAAICLLQVAESMAASGEFDPKPRKAGRVNG